MTSSRSMSIEPNAKNCALCSYKLVIRAHVQPSNQERSASAEFFIYSRMSWQGLNCVCECYGNHINTLHQCGVRVLVPQLPHACFRLHTCSTTVLNITKYRGCIVCNYIHTLPHILHTICARPLIIKIIFRGFPYLISTYYKQKNITTI